MPSTIWRSVRSFCTAPLSAIPTPLGCCSRVVLVGSAHVRRAPRPAPIASIARIILICGNDAAFIWKEIRETPPSASLCRRILSDHFARAANQQRAVRTPLRVEARTRHGRPSALLSDIRHRFRVTGEERVSRLLRGVADIAKHMDADLELIRGIRVACRLLDRDKGVLYGIAAALPVFRTQGFGHFINIASTAGHKTVPTMAVYSGTKFAVRAISEGLRQEAGDHLRVTIISPGMVRTNFAEGVTNQTVKAQLETMP